MSLIQESVIRKFQILLHYILTNEGYELHHAGNSYGIGCVVIGN